jgi:hypothetical protein
MQKQGDQQALYEKLKQSTQSLFFKRYTAMGIKEGLFSDSAGALGKLHDTLVEAAYPELIGRNIIPLCQQLRLWSVFRLKTDAVA